MDKIIKNKRPGTSVQSLFRFQKNSFISYILSDQVWWCNIKCFLSYSKNYICKFTQANSWQHKLFHSHWSFWIYELWKKRQKITKVWISRKRKELFRLNKIHFLKFLKGYHLGKNKHLIKIADTCFNCHLLSLYCCL